MLVLFPAPNMPSEKYNGILYSTEEECIEAQAVFLNAYETKPQEYKDRVLTETFCLPFDAFPIQGMNYKDSSFGT